MELKYTKSIPVRLRDAGFDERWLQNQIEDDMTTLGLGDLTILKREKKQKPGGRIDFLAYDPDEDVRYTIEIMLGKLDASHIIRTIEYWDIERKRYPNIEHRAVIVAEDITGRFFNIISLFNQFIPVIALQLNAFTVDNRLFLNFAKVLDITDSGNDESEDMSEQVDRNYWLKKTNEQTIKIVDEAISLLNDIKDTVRVTYNKGHIAIGSTGVNFAWLYPRKKVNHCIIKVKTDPEKIEEYIARLDDCGIGASKRKKKIQIQLNIDEINQNKQLINELFSHCEEFSRT